jgi:hypothetical protein
MVEYLKYFPLRLIPRVGVHSYSTLFEDSKGFGTIEKLLVLLPLQFSTLKFGVGSLVYRELALRQHFTYTSQSQAFHRASAPTPLSKP